MYRFLTSVFATLLVAGGMVLQTGAAFAQAPAVSIAPASQEVTEGANAVFIVTVHGTTLLPTTATYLVTGLGTSAAASPQDLGNADNTMPLAVFPAAETVVIAAGMNSTATIMLPVFRDGLNEAQETFAVRLTGAEGGASTLAGAAIAIATIPASTDFTLSIRGPSMAMEGDSVRYDFVLGGINPAAPLSVPYRVTPGGAATADDLQIQTPGGDPTGISGLLTLAVGATTGTLIIRITDDRTTETMAESIVVSVNTDASFAGNNNIFPAVITTGVQTTLLDPSAGRVILSRGPGEAQAEGSTATFIVRVAGVTTDITTATYVVTAFGAEPAGAADFGDGANPGFPSGSVMIPAGADPSATIELFLADDDSLPEAAETFGVVLTGAGGGTTPPGAEPLLVGTIAADGVTIAAPSVASVAEGRGAAFVVTARGRTVQDTVVTWAVSADGSDSASPADFGNAGNTAPLAAFSSGTVTIEAGINSTATIVIPVYDDAVNEDRETFRVTLLSAEGGMTATGPPPLDTAQGVIAASRDDFTYSLSGPATAVEGDTVEYTVRLNGGVPLTEDLEFGYLVENVGAASVSGDDYQVLQPPGFRGHAALQPSPVTIPAGSVRAGVRIRLVVDSVVEATAEQLRVSLHTAVSGNDGVLPQASDSISITTEVSDSPARRVTLSEGPAAPVAEGVAAHFTVRVAGNSTATTTVRYSVVGSGDNPASAADFADGVFPSGSVTVAPGMNSTATLSILPAVDVITEAMETFTLTLDSAVGEGPIQPTLPARPSLDAAIAADDAGVIRVLADAGEVAEGGTADFTVHVSGTIDASAQVRYRVTTSTAALQPRDFGDGDDDSFPSGTLTLPAGTDSVTNFSIPIHDDALNEGAEIFAVVLERVTENIGDVALRLATQEPVRVTIAGSDPIAVALEAPQSVAEGDLATFAVAVSGGAREGNLTLAWATTSTTAGSADFGSDTAATAYPSGTLTFAPQDRRMSISIPIYKDFVVEDAETFVLQLQRATGVAGPVSAATRTTVTITASTARSRVFAVTGPASVAEGGTAMYVVTMESGAAIAAGGLTLNWTIEGRGAQPAQAADFSAATGSLTFDAGDSVGATRSFTVMTAEDALAEGAEEFVPVIDETTVGVRQAAVAAIRDNDEVTATLSGGGEAAEGGSIAFTVTLSGSARAGAVTIPWRITADTDSATVDADTSDYEPDSGFFTVESAATAATLNLSVVDDDLTERAETFRLHLDAATTGADSFRTLASSQTATIPLNDPRQVVFAQTQHTAGEVSGVISVALRFEPPGAAGEDVTVQLAPAPGIGGITDADYRLFDAAGAVALAEGATNTRVTIPAGQPDAPAKIEIQDLAGYENSRTLSLIISDALIGGTAAGPVTVGEVSGAGITILDNDRVSFGFLRADQSFVEDTRAVPIVFMQSSGYGARISGQPDLQVLIRQSPAPVSLNVDPSLGYTSGTVTRVFPFADGIVNVSFSINDDNTGLEDEEPGTWHILTHAEARAMGLRQDPRIGFSGQVVTTLVIVLDNEFLRDEEAWRTAGPIAVPEGQSALTAAESPMLSARSGREVVFGWEVAAASSATFGATEGQDYRLTTASSAGRRAIIPPLVFIDDDVAEEDEQFELSYTGITSFPSGLVVTGGSRTVTIVDDDDVRVNFDATETTLAEGATQRICVVAPAYTRNQTVTATVTVNDVTAARDADYTVTGDGRLSDFTSSSSIQRRCLEVTIMDDSAAESDEVFTLNLVVDDGSDTRVSSLRKQVTVTIEDDDPVSFDNVASLYTGQPSPPTCGDCADDDKVVYRLANPVVAGGSFGFDVQVRLTPPDAASPSAFLSQSTFGIVHDGTVLDDCRASAAGLTGDRGASAFYLGARETIRSSTTHTTVWTFTAANTAAYDPDDAAANRTRFGELTHDYRNLFHIDCNIADADARTDVGIAAVGWNGLRTLVASGRDRRHLAYAANRFEDAATSGDPWAVEVNLYGDGRRVDLVMNEPLQAVSTETVALMGGGGATVTAATLAADSSRTIEVTLSAIAIGNIVVADAQSLVTDTDNPRTVTGGHLLARLPVHDTAAPEMISATFTGNDTVELIFDTALRADTVSTGDFVLSVLNPVDVSGVELVSVAHSGTSATLVVRPLGSVVQEGVARSADGAERLRVRLARNFEGDLVADVVDVVDHPVATHQLPSQALAFVDTLRPTLLSFTAVERTSSSAGYRMIFRAVFSEPVNLTATHIRVLEVDTIGGNTGGAEVGGIATTVAATTASYTITLGPLSTLPAVGNGYAVEIQGAMVADEADNPLLLAVSVRALSGGHNGRGVFHASEDFDVPELTMEMESVTLNAQNSTMTLVFNEPVRVADGAGAAAFGIAVADNPWITTATVTSVVADGVNLLVGVAFEGPPPLNGRSPEGLEQATLTLPGGVLGDETGNLFPETQVPFTLNENAAPLLVSMTRFGDPVPNPATTASSASWTVTLTEPVDEVDADDFLVCRGAAQPTCPAARVVTSTIVVAIADAPGGREYIVTAGGLAQLTGASAFYHLRLSTSATIVERTGGRGIVLERLAGETHEIPDTIAPTLQSFSLDFPVGGNRASAAFVFSEAVNLVDGNDFNASLRIAVTTGSEWLAGAMLAGAVTATAATLVIPLQTTGAAPLNGGSPDGGEAVAVTLEPGAVTDVPGNPVQFTRQLVFPENAAPQLRLRTAGDAVVADFRRLRVLPDTGGTRRMTWRIRFTEAVAGVTTGSFTLLSAPGVVEGAEDGYLDDLTPTLADAAGIAALQATSTTPSSVVVSPVTGEGAITITSGTETFSTTWDLTAGGLSARNPGTDTLAHYVVRFEDAQAITGIRDDESRPFTALTPPRTVVSEVQSGGDTDAPRLTPMARVMQTTVAAGSPRELLLQVTVRDLLSTMSAMTFARNDLGVATPVGMAQLPAGDWATVTGMELMRYSAATTVLVTMDGVNTTLSFRARLSGSLDNGESAVGGERFAFTIPGNRLVDVFENTQTAAMTFTAEVPESGAPEMTRFSVLSRVERTANTGVFDLSYRLEFTEPVAFPASALALYSLPDRRSPTLGGAMRTDISPASVESAGTQAAFIVTYTNVMRPDNVRGYVAVLRAAGATESLAPRSKTIEDCPVMQGGGCLSASADVSDREPPRLAGAGWAGNRLWLQFDEPVRVLAGGVEAAGGATLAGFEAIPGYRMGQSTTAGNVSVTSAVYRATSATGSAAGIVLELGRAIGSTETPVWVRYTPPADSADGISDTADVRGLNDRANRIARVQMLMVRQGLTDDSDGDGIADAAEIEYGGDPLAPLSSAERAALPQVLVSRGTAPDTALVALSGIRAHGAAEHLGVRTTGSVASVSAWYLTNTFGYTLPMGETFNYACTGRFPANYAAAVADGGCAAVDFANLPPGAHTIGWLATTASGYWRPQDTNSTLPEQRIVRVPELSMNAARLFFVDSDAPSATVSVAASHDGAAALQNLTLTLSDGQMLTSRKEFSVAVRKSDTTSSAQTLGIAGLSGGGAALWHAGTDTATLTGSSYSLGLVTQTTVVRLDDNSLPPTAGLPGLYLGACCGAADLRAVLQAGAYTAVLPVMNLHASRAPAVTATAGAGVLSGLSASRSGSGDGVRVAMTVAAVTTPTSVTLRVSVPGRGTTATVDLTWPVVAAGNALADVPAMDADNDGIADRHDRYRDDRGLPVAVSSDTEVLAGADSWHHIRAAMKTQRVRAGARALMRAAAMAADRVPGEEPPYSDYASSFFDIEGFAVVYDFSVYNVDYATQTAPGTTAMMIAGGRAGVIIPLPQSLYDDAGLALFKYRGDRNFERFATVPGGNEYGFSPLVDGACPDDTGSAGSAYRENNALRSSKAAGDACLVVWLVDGGAYDEDGAVNSIVVDPLGLRADGAIRRSGGGGFGAAGLVVLLLGALLTLLYRRRRTPAH